MTQPILLIDRVYAVEMSAGAEGYKIECIPQADLYELQFFKISDDPDFFGELEEFKSVDLPAGTWEIIYASKECTEESENSKRYSRMQDRGIRRQGSGNAFR